MDAYLGEIRMFAGTFAPQNWMTCNGQLLSISQNAALFSLIGTIYGGDGQSTFALPNLVGRAPVHAGQGSFSYQVGQMAGSQTTTITQQQMPMHNHTLQGANIAANQFSPANNCVSIVVDKQSQQPLNSYNDLSEAGTELAAMNTKSIGVAGGSQPLNIQSPVLAVTFIICTNGLWPPRP